MTTRPPSPKESMFRTVLVVALMMLLGLSGSVAAQTQADRDAIQSVITNQIEAFRHDDGPSAFAFASPTVQEIFGTPERFMAMVRQGYQPVYRPRSVAFEALTQQGGHLVQRVAVIGPDGRAHLALYYMIRDADGVWRIDACELADSDDVGA